MTFGELKVPVDCVVVFDSDLVSEGNELGSFTSLLISGSLELSTFLFFGLQGFGGGLGFLLSIFELLRGSALSVPEFLESSFVFIPSLGEISVDEGTESLLHLLSLRLFLLDVLFSLFNPSVGGSSEGFVI